MNSLTEALLQGRKIEAIKIYRGVTGMGLKESKDAIEEIETSLRAKFPGKFTAAANNRKGCFGAATVLVCVAIGGAFWLLGPG